MSERLPPALVMDVGGTLLVRERPGAFHRARRALADSAVPVDDHSVESQVAMAVFTEGDRAAVASRISEALALSAGAEASLRRALGEPEGKALILPGAVRLLEMAAATGWRVVVATNAAAWVPPLPAELASSVSLTFCSSALKQVKQSNAFWKQLQASGAVDASRCLVIGDDFQADVEYSRQAGFLTVHLDGAVRTVDAIADWLESAGPPPSDAVGVVGGEPVQWAGRWVLESPHLAPLLATVTRFRARIRASGRTLHATLVRRRSHPPALLLDDPEICPPRLAWLVPRRDRRPVAPPPDLACLLDAERLSLDRLSAVEKRHLGSMVREAKDPAIRKERMAEIVALLRLRQPEPRL